jgi:hypothetical protein
MIDLNIPTYAIDALDKVGGSIKRVESTTITYSYGAKYISFIEYTYPTTDGSGLYSSKEDIEYVADCPIVSSYEMAGAYVIDSPTSGGINGSILIKY